MRIMKMHAHTCMRNYEDARVEMHKHECEVVYNMKCMIEDMLYSMIRDEMIDVNSRICTTCMKT